VLAHGPIVAVDPAARKCDDPRMRLLAVALPAGATAPAACGGAPRDGELSVIGNAAMRGRTPAEAGAALTAAEPD
jgi:hypothetical protein